MEQTTHDEYLGNVDHPETHDGIRPGTFIAGAVAGAALMYLFDPERGNRRRKLIADQVNHAAHVAGDATGKTARDLRNRTHGVAARLRSRVSGNGADAWVLADRVRAELGRVVSHPSAINVNVDDGTITLTGAVLAGEVRRLIERVERVHGVHEVVDQLHVYDSAENVPELQGGVPRTGDRFELRQENWTPAARLFVSLAGGTMAAVAATRRGPIAALFGLAGMAMVTRALTNTELRRLAGARGRRGIDVQKTININAPREVVFTYLTDYENWPRFMTHVREIRETGPGQQHWVVEGPAGTTLEWDAEITRFVENELVSWKSVEGAAVRHAGTMRVDRNADGSTRADIRMSYNPPVGAAGHAVAVLFHADPKHQMDDDLARLKTTIETGMPPHDAARPV